MAFDLWTWLADNWLALLIGAIAAAIFEILFKEFIWNEFVAPSFRYKANYHARQISKWARNSRIEFSHSANAKGLDTYHIPKASIEEIAKVLRSNKIHNRKLSDLGIAFDNQAIGKLTFSGTIEFGADAKIQYVTGLSITVSTQIGYNSMEPDITAITHFMDMLKSYINQGLGKPVMYTANIGIKLDKLEALTGILKDLNIDYMQLGGDMQLSITKDKVVFEETSSQMIDYSVVVPKLKQFVVLFA